MSGLEIERKFLVRKKGGEYKKAAFSVSHIKQGYIPADGATVRIRVRDEQAFLTIKSRSLNGGLTRYEFEIEIPYADADDLLKLCRGGFIDKHSSTNGAIWSTAAVMSSKSTSFMALTKDWSLPRSNWPARTSLTRNRHLSAPK